MPKIKTVKPIKKTRPPIVTVMGHVDHGKTTLLDSIRQTNVTKSEFGGITQHIGAYQVQTPKGEVTFIDTPGHAAFTEMRSRGGQAADIVVLVVAADDGVQPQTIEAINHAKAAEAPIIVAINKIDAPGANVDKIKRELSENDVLVEEYGGDVMSVEISALNGTNIDQLLESILTLAELLELPDTTDEMLLGTVIESKLDKRKGVLATILIQSGTLKKGDKIWAGGSDATVRSMTNFKGEQIPLSTPGTPAEILGFKTIPEIGSIVVEIDNKGKVESIYNEQMAAIAGLEEEDTTSEKLLNIIIKADAKGTLEALEQSLFGIEAEKAKIKIILKGVGNVNESDVLLASATGSTIFSFNAKETGVMELAKQRKVIVKDYNIIYELLEDVQKALEGELLKQEEDVKGLSIVKKIFPLPSGDVIAGCEIIMGTMAVGRKVIIWENEASYKLSRKETTEEILNIYEGRIKKIKSGKVDIKKASKGSDCGILVTPNFPNFKNGNYIQVM
ncbi:MAG: translation initiation factor IF-2 [bacterium]|nr:translation initiation factor IF-2 [bacterium]